jgi:Domain of unknown function (DUF4328)/Protein of unknown function (DUF2510)
VLHVWQDGGVSDDVSGYPGAPPGWYADPAGGPGQRWWDGYAWTEATVLPGTPPPPPGPAPGPPSYAPQGRPVSPGHLRNQPGLGNQPNATDLVAREVPLTPLSRFAFAFYGVNALAGVINLRLHQAQELALGHQFRVAYHAAQHGQPAPTITNTSMVDPLVVLVGLVEIGAVIVACIWQFRAASAARALGLPATHSPGWGVGSWFVPIVNFWMPYQAIRDCLPPGDPDRKLVLRWWLVLLGAELFSVVAAVAAWFSTSTSLVFCIVVALCALGIFATAPRVVLTISSRHQTALGGTNPP